jgi:hypothetical protein
MKRRGIGSLFSRAMGGYHGAAARLCLNVTLGLLFLLRSIPASMLSSALPLTSRSPERFRHVCGVYSVYGIEPRTPIWDSWSPLAGDAQPVESRRLEDRIRELCTKAVATPESAEFNDVIQQLREALREHAKRLRQLFVAKAQSLDRRKAS